MATPLLLRARATGRALAAAALWLALGPAPAAADSDLDRCLDARGLVRLARVVGPDGAPTFARVAAHADGIPSEVIPLPAPELRPLDLSAAFEVAADLPADAPRWTLPADGPERAARICAPVPLSQAELDAEQRVIVAAGLNYAAHAEESGGGDVFLFPKPAAPGAPYGVVAAPDGALLLDYEVELGFVLLEAVDLAALPTPDAFLERSAFFLANDVTDREPIIANATLTGPGTGFIEAKGQPGFLPAGPWLVRGRELFAALEACGATGLGIRLEVDEGEGFRPRQGATTDAMILDPHALLARLAAEVAVHGPRSPMPVRRPGGVRDYPLAIESDANAPILPAGSLVLTGTPEGVALATPKPLTLIARGLLRLRGPFEQFRQQERARAAAGGPGGYLEPGDRVRAQIDGLGTQIVRIAEPGAALPPDPCSQHGPAALDDTPTSEVARP